MNYGPDEGTTSVDHAARISTFEMEFHATGTLAPEAIRYLIGQAKWADHFEKSGNRLVAASRRLSEGYEEEIAELTAELATARAETAIVRESLTHLTKSLPISPRK